MPGLGSYIIGRIDLNNDLADDSKVRMPDLGSYLAGLTSTMTLLMTLRLVCQAQGAIWQD